MRALPGLSTMVARGRPAGLKYAGKQPMTGFSRAKFMHWAGQPDATPRNAEARRAVSQMTVVSGQSSASPRSVCTSASSAARSHLSFVPTLVAAYVQWKEPADGSHSAGSLSLLLLLLAAETAIKVSGLFCSFAYASRSSTLRGGAAGLGRGRGLGGGEALPAPPGGQRPRRLGRTAVVRAD